MAVKWDYLNKMCSRWKIVIVISHKCFSSEFQPNQSKQNNKWILCVNTKFFDTLTWVDKIQETKTGQTYFHWSDGSMGLWHRGVTGTLGNLRKQFSLKSVDTLVRPVSHWLTVQIPAESKLKTLQVGCWDGLRICTILNRWMRCWELP